MSKLFKKAGRLVKKAVGLGTLGLAGDMPGHWGKDATAADKAAEALKERERTTPVMPDEEAIRKAARKRVAGSLGRTGRASTFLSDPSEGL